MEELDPVFNRVAAYFALLSEPMRLKIMHAVCIEEKTVGEVVAATGATQTNVSRHLNRMHAGGVLSRHRDGNQVYYKVADATLVEMCRNVCIRIASEIDLQQPLRDDLLQLIPDSKLQKPTKSPKPTRRAPARRSVRHA